VASTAVYGVAAPRLWIRSVGQNFRSPGPWHCLRSDRKGSARSFPMDDDDAPPSPPMSTPQNQLAISLLNNLLQMQGLENTILNQQNTNTSPSPSSSPSTTQPSYNPQLLLEQQIKLTQLQQLQQLQSQIFQQQVLLFPILPLL
jgi:hypothetical protein